MPTYEANSAEKLNYALNALFLASPIDANAMAKRQEQADASKLSHQLDALLLPGLQENKALAESAEKQSAQALNQNITGLLLENDVSIHAQNNSASDFDGKRPVWTGSRVGIFQAATDDDGKQRPCNSAAPAA